MSGRSTRYTIGAAITSLTALGLLVAAGPALAETTGDDPTTSGTPATETESTTQQSADDTTASESTVAGTTAEQTADGGTVADGSTAGQTAPDTTTTDDAAASQLPVEQPVAAATTAEQPQPVNKAAIRKAKRRSTRWLRKMRKNRRHAVRHARCLGKKRLPSSLRRPIKRPRATAGERLTHKDWARYAVRLKKRSRRLAKYVRVTWRRIKNPRGHSVNRWLPLLRHERWPRRQRAMALRVIRRESSGNPRLIGAGNYHGLFQISWSFSRGRFDLRNPVVNVRVAKQLYSRRGWQPWASTAY